MHELGLGKFGVVHSAVYLKGSWDLVRTVRGLGFWGFRGLEV